MSDNPLVPVSIMPVVYVLTVGEYSDNHIVGIYSSEDKAEIARGFFGGEIEEWRLDECLSDIEAGRTLWSVRLHRETGDVLQIAEEEGTWRSYSARNSDHITIDVNKNIFTYVWGDSRAHAIKVASERRRAYLAGEYIHVG